MFGVDEFFENMNNENFPKMRVKPIDIPHAAEDPNIESFPPGKFPLNCPRREREEHHSTGKLPLNCPRREKSIIQTMAPY